MVYKLKPEKLNRLVDKANKTISRQSAFNASITNDNKAKSLRYNASEARDYLTYQDLKEERPKQPLQNRPGRGVSGESSN